MTGNYFLKISNICYVDKVKGKQVFFPLKTGLLNTYHKIYPLKVQFSGF